MAMRRNPFVKMGKPPAPASAFGAARGPKKPPMGGGMPSMGAPPMGGAGPMTGFQPQVPGAAFRRGGGTTPSYHDDERLERGHSEHGHVAFQKLCRGGSAK